MFGGDFLFDGALLDEVLIGGIAECDDSTCEAVWVVLGLQLHLLLLVHLDGVQTILVQMRRFVRNLLLQLLLLEQLLLLLVLFDGWEIEIFVI